MFVCDRCESSFSPARVAMAVICPRCWGRHGVLAPLTFAPFPPYFLRLMTPPVMGGRRHATKETSGTG